MEAAQRLVPFSAYDLANEYARAPRLSVYKRVVMKASRVGVGALLERALTRTFDGFSRRLSERALAIHALVEEIRSGDPSDAEIDPDDDLRRKLDIVEADFASIADDVEKLSRYGARVLAPEAAERCKLSARAAAAEVRELKGAIQAHDANVAALRRAARRAAQTPIDLDAQLDDAFGA